ncbi:hypothetical protein CLOM621_06495 [Clostridium sp. M62/1]|nr:hypothetical protein CLOM621_06495 [Clostridium sp. M62/1]
MAELLQFFYFRLKQQTRGLKNLTAAVFLVMHDAYEYYIFRRNGCQRGFAFCGERIQPYCRKFRNRIERLFRLNICPALARMVDRKKWVFAGGF